MNQQPDKFFRDKLEGYQKPAPASAWDKVEQGLAKKSNNNIWLRAAAAILLLAVAAFLLWTSSRQSEIRPMQAEVEKPEIQLRPQHQSTPIAEEFQDRVTEQKESYAIAQKTSTPKKVTILIEEDITPDVPQPQIDNQEFIASAEPDESLILVHHVDKSIENTEAKTDNTITLVYSANEVNEKYFNQDAYAQATTDKKKTSTLKRLLNKAYDLKNNQDPLGELRQRKNEILALNSKTEKQRNENK
ncbi:MAG: hypothetical protein JNM57_13950 [Cyclobacteriaceae bacterium]|nr:hypothetical protein [Cyclobacteriaceae bacterium]